MGVDQLSWCSTLARIGHRLSPAFRSVVRRLCDHDRVSRNAEPWNRSELRAADRRGKQARILGGAPSSQG